MQRPSNLSNLSGESADLKQTESKKKKSNIVTRNTGIQSGFKTSMVDEEDDGEPEAKRIIARANNASKQKGLLLGPDIYSITYFGFVKDVQYESQLISTYT